MDRRVYVLPLASILVVVALFMNPDITGYIVADPSGNEVSADISVRISEGGFVPEDSIVTVYFGDQESSMSFQEFIDKTGQVYDLKEGRIEEIGYEGQGFWGPYTYAIDISEFGIDTILEPGEYDLVVEVSHRDIVISQTSETINV